MPNGGITPDCVHCKWFHGKPIHDEKEPYCTHHDMKLTYIIRAFCSNHAANQLDPEPQEKDWLDRELDRSQLQNDMMYLWLGGHGKSFFYVPLVPINEYKDWTQEKFLDELARLSEEHRND